MSSLEVGLVTAVVLLTVLMAALLRSHGDAVRRIDLLERKLARGDRREARVAPAVAGGAAATTAPVAPVSADEPEGDAVDIEGTSPAGEPLTIALEAAQVPTLVAFLSTSCGICMSVWTRLRDGGLADVAPGVRPVVVLKDASHEDLAAVREMEAAGHDLTVVLSSEAWVDYEVPGSPYLILVGGSPTSVLDESTVQRWDDVAALARRAAAPTH